MYLERGVNKRRGYKRGRASKILLRTFIILLVLIVVGMFAGSYYAISQMSNHRVEKFETTPEKLGLKGETISVVSSDGTPIKGWLIPNKSPKGIVIVLHGMDGMDASSVLGTAKFLYEGGYSAIALDMRAHGMSGGNNISFAYHEPEDVSAVLDWIKGKDEYKNLPVGLIGLSMGGAAAIRTAAARPDVDAVVSLSSYASVEEMSSDYISLMGGPEILAKASLPFNIAVFGVKFGVIPWDSSPAHDIAKIAPRPVLIGHGTADDQTMLKHAYELYEASGKKAELWIVDGAGHCVFKGDGSGPEDAPYREKILGFLDKSLKK